MNRHMRLLFAGTAVASASLIPAHAEMTVKVTDPDGNISRTPLTTDTRISFLAEGIDVANSGAETLSIPYVRIQSISFDSATSSVAGINADDGLRLRRNPVENILEVVGHNGKPTRLSISSLGGSRMMALGVWNGESIDVSSLAPGIYLLTIDNTTIKFIKK